MLLWLSNENLRNLLGTSATITTVLQFLTGCLICQNYIRKKSTGEVIFFIFGLLEIVGIINLIYFRQARCRLRVVYYRARSGCAMEYLSMRMQSFWSTQLASFSSRFIAFRITFLPLTSGG